jgi:transcriptional regulator NrdR family protein
MFDQDKAEFSKKHLLYHRGKMAREDYAIWSDEMRPMKANLAEMGRVPLPHKMVKISEPVTLERDGFTLVSEIDAFDVEVSGDLYDFGTRQLVALKDPTRAFGCGPLSECLDFKLPDEFGLQNTVCTVTGKDCPDEPLVLLRNRDSGQITQACAEGFSQLYPGKFLREPFYLRIIQDTIFTDLLSHARFENRVANRQKMMASYHFSQPSLKLLTTPLDAICAAASLIVQAGGYLSVKQAQELGKEPSAEQVKRLVANLKNHLSHDGTRESFAHLKFVMRPLVNEYACSLRAKGGGRASQFRDFDSKVLRSLDGLTVREVKESELGYLGSVAAKLVNTEAFERFAAVYANVGFKGIEKLDIRLDQGAQKTDAKDLSLQSTQAI